MKKLFSCVLALAMLASLAATGAWAEEGIPYGTTVTEGETEDGLHWVSMSTIAEEEGIPYGTTVTEGDTEDGLHWISQSATGAEEWYSDAVAAAKEKGILSGYEDGSLRIESTVTRAEAAKMMVLAAGLEIDESATLTFTDCYANWYVPYVAAAVKAGMINGYEDGTFHPNASITRAELAALICQSLKLSSTDGAVSFKDVSADAWYADEVAMASAGKYVSGDADTGLYRPEDSVTRAELAQVVYNIYLK